MRLWYGVRAPEIYEYGKGKNSRTRDSGNCRRDALIVGKQNFIEILRSPIPITVSRVEWRDAAVKWLLYFKHFYTIYFPVRLPSRALAQ